MPALLTSARAGRKELLTTPVQKLWFILYYLKMYSMFDVLAATFGLPCSNTCEHAPA